MLKVKRMKYPLAVALCLLPLAAMSASKQGCYAAIDYGEQVDVAPKRSLYVIVDQTVDYSKKMKAKVHTLLTEWGQPGDQIKIARFTANFRDSYPSVEFVGHLEPAAGEKYLRSLHLRDRKELESCLQAQREKFDEDYQASLKKVVEGSNPKAPKTDIFYSLKQLSKHMLDKDVKDKTVLLVSDGLENSSISSFYRAGKIRKLNARKEVSKIRRQGLVSHWQGAKIYMLGLGLPPKKEKYINDKKVKNLHTFWERYFVEGKGKVVALGSPDILSGKVM
jgi:hypothetical protein